MDYPADSMVGREYGSEGGREKLDGPTVSMVRREGTKLRCSNCVMVGREGVKIGRPGGNDGSGGERLDIMIVSDGIC